MCPELLLIDDVDGKARCWTSTQNVLIWPFGMGGALK